MSTQFKAAALSLLISPQVRRLRHRWHALRRTLRGGAHRLYFYHRIADPYSLLLCRLLPVLAERYRVEIVVRALSDLPLQSISEPALYDAYALEDSARLAAAWGIDAPGAAMPPRRCVHLAERILAVRPPPALATTLQVSEAAWRGDGDALAAMAGEHGAAAEEEASRRCNRHFRELSRRGHYLGGTLYYEGEWYWGLDRLAFLERRLGDAGLGDGHPALVRERFRPRPAPPQPAEDRTLELFFSFRSPYSYIAVSRVVDLAERYGLRLRLRPVLPMVQRGVPLPGAKLLYIMRDARRLADEYGLPFGRVCDPLGPGVERCLDVFEYAVDDGCEVAWTTSAMEAIFAGGADMGNDRVLARVASSAGIPWEVARGALGEQRWTGRVAANAAALAELGLWGVPTLCLRAPDQTPVCAVWGQDRLWAIEQALGESRPQTAARAAGAGHQQTGD